MGTKGSAAVRPTDTMPHAPLVQEARHRSLVAEGGWRSEIAGPRFDN
jgi:hypothetical protein